MRPTLPDEAPSEADLEREARERVKELRGFYTHAATYLVVNVLLVAVNLLTSPEYFWAVWPLLGWGIGLASHAVGVFGLFRLGPEWEERKVREMVLQRQRGLSAAQVRSLLHEELRAERGADAPDWDRLIHRMENLEAIVTSKDWDLLHAGDDAGGQALPPAETDDPEQHAARIARRVR